MAGHGDQHIPVVTRAHPKRPVGVLFRTDIIRAYAQAISGRDRRFVSYERRRAESVFGLEPLEVDLAEGDPAIGKTLREINPPLGAVVISITREGTILVPRGETTLEAGDHVVALALAGAGAMLRRNLKTEADPLDSSAARN
jgi:K+/H+ antiporter YhaU regulatory subunit KhtT